MSRPETRFARGADGSVACQTLGDGPIDVVFIPWLATNIEVMEWS